MVIDVPATVRDYAVVLADGLPLGFVLSSGGRRSAGYEGETGDCFVRALAVALFSGGDRSFAEACLSFAEAYRMAAKLVVRAGESVDGKIQSSRNWPADMSRGVSDRVSRRALGFVGWGRAAGWPSAKARGVVHLSPPRGELYGHWAAVIDGVLWDDWDSRGWGCDPVFWGP